MKCENCGREMDREEKDTSSGRDVRTYFAMCVSTLKLGSRFGTFFTMRRRHRLADIRAASLPS
jgi:hypothetical protein